MYRRIKAQALVASLCTSVSMAAAQAADISSPLPDISANLFDPNAAIKPSSGFYFGGRSRISALDDTSFTTGGDQASVDYGVGFSGGAVLGYMFAPPRNMVGGRVELEASFSDTSVDQLTINGDTRTEEDSTGSFSTITGYASGFVDFHLGNSPRFSGTTVGRLTPFVGAGIGYSQVSLDGVGSFTDGLLIDDSTDALTYHLSAGVAIALKEKTSIELGYRYEEFLDAEFEAVDGSLSTQDIGRQSFTFGLRRRF